MSTQKSIYTGIVEAIEAGHTMNQVGLPHEFIANAVQTAFEFEGVCNLMKMWADETDERERNEIVADIQKLIYASCNCLKF